MRPSSIFGSLRSLTAFHDDDSNLTRTSSFQSLNPGSPQGFGAGAAIFELAGSSVVHHGETQLIQGMFRKRSHYHVLTESHLVRFKTQVRAADVFSSIPVFGGKGSRRHSRMDSSESQPDLHSSEAYYVIRLNHIVAIHKLEDGRPYFSIEIAYMDEETNNASVMTLQVNDPAESDLWLLYLRTTAEKARLVEPIPFSQTLVDYTIRTLEQENDFDLNHFRMFKVIQKSSRPGGKASSDELARSPSTICILAIGMFKIHLIPIPKLTRADSTTSLLDTVGASHGLMTLVSLNMQSADDGFQLNFRVPLRQVVVLSLASSSITDIALWIRQATDYLRPEWLEQPFTWNVPQSLDDALLPVPSQEEDNGCFARTLAAYCAAYGLDKSRVRYRIDRHCDDAPAFQLLGPDDHRRSKYNLLELLAVMRALRYNETFTTISFDSIDMTILHGRVDEHGWDHVPWTTRSGDALMIAKQENSWLLVQELQALALKSRKLRRLDFSYCLTRKLHDDPVQEVGSGICEALFPLCAKQLTNVDWIILNGVQLADIDIDFFFTAAIQKLCHFRGLDLGCCGIGDRNMNTVLQAISQQGATMESLDLSSNPARLDTVALQQQIQTFAYMRRINLSKICRVSGPEPLIAADIFLAWKLQYVNFSGTALNEKTVEALSVYLRSTQSDTLRSLHLNQCQLTGSDLGSLLIAMARFSTKCRDLHLFVTDNRPERQHDKFIEAISRSFTPNRMTLTMLEYSSEHYFGDLIKALSKNKSLKYLDISKAVLPKDASDETCEALRKMFMKNNTLEELDISGEEAHLEVATLGNGLNHALTGLKNNTTLKILRIEHQRLGLQGASTLASVIEVNEGLREIFCEDNEINLQAFTVLVNSVQSNPSLLYLPCMENDRAMSLKKIDREFNILSENTTSVSTKATVRKTLSLSSHKSRVGSYAFSNNKEIMAVVQGLSEKWDSESARLRGYLDRNRSLVHGLPTTEYLSEARSRSTGALRDTSSDLTPRGAELNVRLGKSKDIVFDGTTAIDGKGEESSSSDFEDLVNVDEGDDIEAALMMTLSLQPKITAEE